MNLKDKFFLIPIKKTPLNPNMFSPVASDVGSLSGCSAVLSLGLKALRAPERITLLSSVHLAAVNKVHMRGFWRQTASRLHFLVDLGAQKKPNVPSASAAWPCPWHGSGQADGRGLPLVGSSPSAAAGSASSVAQMRGGSVRWLMPRQSPEEDFSGCGRSYGGKFKPFER